MWVSKKTAEKAGGSIAGCIVGRVTVGGSRPCVLTEGEDRGAELVACGGGLYLPQIGDEVLVARTADGETIVIGPIAGDGDDSLSSGEICIMADGGGSVNIRKNGDVELCGNIRLTGPTYINGTLVINGETYVPVS